MKLKLDIEGLTEDFFEDTRLFGVMVAARSYRFCWLLNNTLGYDFRLNTDVEVHVLKRGRHYFFPVYQHIVQGTQQVHYIYQNQYDGEYLLPEFRHMDFLWLVKGELLSDEQSTELVQAVKSINGVQLVAELTNEQIRNKGNLVF